MADIVSAETRSRMMSAIRGENTKPELVVRRLLHRLGYRFRLHRKDLPGKPDIVLPKHRTVVFVNGCYWHGHKDCHLFRLPRSREAFWSEKIDANRQRDQRNCGALIELGWSVIVIWECAVAKSRQLSVEELERRLDEAFEDDEGHTEIRAAKHSA